jgi:STE24 endopeptidase
VYFLVVFGFVSRRFERQADVFGCRAVSCGLPDCPPHADLDGHPAPGPRTVPLCPVGIRIFINALANVAMLNGMRPAAWSWRHGSIVRRIDFLEGLVGRPEVETRFQVGVLRMRRGMALLLVTAFVALAVVTGCLP